MAPHKEKKMEFSSPLSKLHTSHVFTLHLLLIKHLQDSCYFIHTKEDYFSSTTNVEVSEIKES